MALSHSTHDAVLMLASEDVHIGGSVGGRYPPCHSRTHACVAALLFKDGWRVHLASTEAEAMEPLGIVTEVCERESLLTPLRAP